MGKRHSTIANSEDNTLILPSGTKMKLSDDYGVDTFKGETVWTNNHYNCEEQDLVVLFDGPASLITSITNDNSTLYTYVVETDKIVFALKRIKKTFAYGNWYGFFPNIQEIKTPQKLKPNTAWTWTYKSLDFLMNSGIYTKDTMKAFQQHIIYPQEMDAVKNNIIRQSMGYETLSQGLQFKYLIDEKTLGKMVEDKLFKLWGWFTTIGTFVSGLMGILFVIKVILTLVDTGVNITFCIKLLGGVRSF
ncbi:hypothetical protein QTP88_013610 [Uroleucon formosanum]